MAEKIHQTVLKRPLTCSMKKATTRAVQTVAKMAICMIRIISLRIWHAYRLLHLVFVQTFFLQIMSAYPRLQSEHIDNVQDRVQWARLPRHDNAFQRVLVLSDFFRLLNICFCLLHLRLRTPGLRNRQQCAYQVVRSHNVFFIFVFLMSHLCLSIPLLIDHLCWVMSMLDMPMSASP